MATHENYFEIAADTHYELGLREGELFGEQMRRAIEDEKEDDSWSEDVDEARSYVGVSAAAFPHLIQEVHGYAEGARVCFEEAWALMLEDELSELPRERCTTVVTNRGTLIGHNEDWDASAANSICVLRKRVGDTNILELFYYNSLGGNAISVNSHGFVHAVNALSHKDHQIGLPRNLVARWLSETRSPEVDSWTFAQLKRSSGYHHTIVSKVGRIWSIECTATQYSITKPQPPFVHTNHYLTDLSEYEGRGLVRGTRERYRCAMENVRDQMSPENLRHLIGDTSEGRRRSIFNNRTIGRMIVDFTNKTAHVWLRREDDKGWVQYPIDAAPS